MSKDSFSSFELCNLSEFSSKNANNLRGLKEDPEKPDGFLKIYHSDMDLIIHHGRTKAELLVLFCVYRFTRGFERNECRASQGFISKWTGLDISSVKRAQSSLFKRGLLQRLNNKNLKQCARLKLLLKNTDPLVAECTQKSSGTLPLQETATGGSLPLELVKTGGKMPLKKEILLKKKKSFLFMSKRLQDHIHSFSNAWERSLELKALKQLQEQQKFDISQVERAFCYVKEKGTLGSKGECLYPLAYLSKAIERVLELVGEEIVKRASSPMNSQSLPMENPSCEQKRELELQVATQLFEKELKSAQAQEREIARLLDLEHPRFKPSGSMRRKMGIILWMREKSGKDFFKKKTAGFRKALGESSENVVLQKRKGALA